jgi:pyruvate dehydrogenase E2 component (dihydrolipoamide acetyltransferase)
MRELRVPKLALGEDERMTVLQWLLEPGAELAEGQPILEVETDKASMELEAPFGGVLAGVVCDVGAEVEPGMVLAWIADPGETYDPAALPEVPETVARPAPPQQPAPVSPPLTEAVTTAPAPQEPAEDGIGAVREFVTDGELRGLPRAGASASAQAPGTPPSQTATFPMAQTQVGTRPVASSRPPDPPAASQTPPELAGAFTSAPLSRSRSAVARTMNRSNAVPQFSVTRDLVAGRLSEALDQLRGETPEATLSDVILLAVARILRGDPRLNAWLAEDATYAFEQVNIALAVDGPSGVVAPVIRRADERSAAELVRERMRLVSGVSSGGLSGQDLLGATFTVSNIGPLGGDAIVPMLVPPQVAILGLGRLRDLGAGAIVTATFVGDHRALDGGDGARFLAALEERLASPDALFDSRWADSAAVQRIELRTTNEEEERG